jgi:hypothetical protein
VNPDRADLIAEALRKRRERFRNLLTNPDKYDEFVKEEEAP